MKFTVICSDARQRYLSEALQKDGYEVKEWKISENPSDADIKDALHGAYGVVLPVPATDEKGNITNTQLSFERLLKFAGSQQIIFGGKLPTAENMFLCDYADREDFAVLNAVPTAEGAIQTAMEHTETTIRNTKCLVIGFGRIGKVLAEKLKLLGADVTVSARKSSDFAWIDVFGYRCADTDKLREDLSGYEIIFNTVPKCVLDENRLKFVSALCIDLASKPGGIDFAAAQRMGVKTVQALSLPGKVAPKTAGVIVEKTICNILNEIGVQTYG